MPLGCPYTYSGLLAEFLGPRRVDLSVYGRLTSYIYPKSMKFSNSASKVGLDFCSVPPGLASPGSGCCSCGSVNDSSQGPTARSLDLGGRICKVSAGSTEAEHVGILQPRKLEVWRCGPKAPKDPDTRGSVGFLHSKS